MAEAWLSLGGNIGDRKAAIDSAVARLAELPGTAVTARSLYYRTVPVGPVAQDWFVNIVVAVRTDLDAESLREACRTIESALGRDRAREISWGPRVIDIDVLASSDEPGALAHRDLAYGYVIVPLAEIAPSLVIGGRTVAEYRTDADGAGVTKLDWPVPPCSS